MKANFEKAWNKFDINNDGFVKAEETHTFMRSLMGKLNKFALAPGSLSDIGGAGADVAPRAAAPVVRRPAPAPKPAPVQALAEEAAPADGGDDADLAKLAEQLEKNGVDATDLNLVDLDI